MGLNIFVCDDDVVQIDLLSCFIHSAKSEYEFNIIAASSGEELLLKIDKINPDIVFLDIEMKDLNGIDTGMEIRQRFKDVVLVYITGYKDYALDAFEVKSLDYIIKPITIERFNKIMEDIIIRIDQIKLYEENCHVFTIRSKSAEINLKYKDIIYFEKLFRKIIVVTAIEEYGYYGNFKDLIHNLDTQYFLHCHQGYIVNKHMIKGLQGDELLLHHTDTIIPVSRRCKKLVKKIFEDSLFE